MAGPTDALEAGLDDTGKQVVRYLGKDPDTATTLTAMWEQLSPRRDPWLRTGMEQTIPDLVKRGLVIVRTVRGIPRYQLSASAREKLGPARGPGPGT